MSIILKHLESLPKDGNDYRNELMLAKDGLIITIGRQKSLGLNSNILLSILNKIDQELRIMFVELEEEWYSLPNGKKAKINSITDALYYERLYGKQGFKNQEEKEGSK